MNHLGLRLIRRALAGTLAVGVFALVVLVGASHAAPFFGYQVFVVRGASMTPTIPLGSVVAARATAAGMISAGDVVTFKLPNGVAVTHRVIEVVDEPDGLYLQTQGDANATPDADLIPERAVVGVVDRFVPVAGYVMALLSIPSGLVSVMSMLAALMLGMWIIDDQTANGRARRQKPTPTQPQTGEVPA